MIYHSLSTLNYINTQVMIYIFIGMVQISQKQWTSLRRNVVYGRDEANLRQRQTSRVRSYQTQVYKQVESWVHKAVENFSAKENQQQKQVSFRKNS